MSQTIGSKFEPRLEFVAEVVERYQKRLVVVEAQRNGDVPYHDFDGRAFIREGTVTRQLSLPEKQSLERKRSRDLHSGSWRCDRCGSWVGTLMSVEVTDQGMRKVYGCRRGGEFWPAA